MQVIPILIVEDMEAAVDFYTEVFQAGIVTTVADTTTISVQGQALAIRKASDKDPADSGDGILLLVETAAPDVIEQAALDHGSSCLVKVDDYEHGVRAGRIRDPYGFQWIISTPYPR